MWKPKNFDEACKRAAGRRAYNRKRRLERERRISRLIRILDSQEPKGRELAVLLKVSESTISRDIRFIRGRRGNFRQIFARYTDAEMKAHNFRWLEGGMWELTFRIG